MSQVYKNLISFFIPALSCLLFVFSAAHAAPTIISTTNQAALTSAAGTMHPGNERGRMVVGDINCDGIKDLIISEPFNWGFLFVLYGGQHNGTSITNGAVMPNMFSGQTGNYAEYSLIKGLSGSSLGVNLIIKNINPGTGPGQDQCDDIIALGATPAISVYKGSAAGVQTTPYTTINWGAGQGSGYAFLNNLGRINGDVNQDGLSTVLDDFVSVCSENTGTLCYLLSIDELLNGVGNLETRADFTLLVQNGWRSITSGDIDQDGFTDLVAANSSSNTDGVHIFYGPLSHLGTNSLIVSEPVFSNSDVIIYDYRYGGRSGFGSYLELSLPKNNNSEFLDLIIGNTQEDLGQGLNNVGRMHVIRGESLAALKPAPGAATPVIIANDTVTTTTPYNYNDLDVFYYCTDLQGNYFGSNAQSSIGADLNGDGYGDMVLGTTNYDANQRYGRSYIVYGGDLDTIPSGTDLQLTSTNDNAQKYMDGENPNDKLSNNVVTGDVTGDGLDDVIIAASGYDNGAGKTYIIPGEATDVDGDGIMSAVLLDLDGDGQSRYERLDCNDKKDGEGTHVWYADADGDGFGDAANSIELCDNPTGRTPIAYVDNGDDCNDADANVSALHVFYVDADHDGFGSATQQSVCANVAPVGFSAQTGDCNDNDGAVHQTQNFYVDADHDGLGGTATQALCAITAPTGYSAQSGDCDDNNGAIQTPVNYYVDGDGDGIGGTTVQAVCSAQVPAGFSTVNTDCNDGDQTVQSPQSYFIDADHDGHGSTQTAQVCAATAPVGYATINDDCDDNQAQIFAPQNFYIDADQDGFGSDQTAALCAVTAPVGYSSQTGDCNDNDGGVHQTQNFYVDTDHDGIGGTTTQAVCAATAPTGFSAQSGDCDDNNGAIQNPINYYVDADHDGVGSLDQQALCVLQAPQGYAVVTGDCNDNDAAVHDGQLYYVDGDGDGLGGATQALLCAGDAPNGYSEHTGDCNDANGAIQNPVNYFVDQDGDGVGGTNVQAVCALVAPQGFSTVNTDCNDNDQTVNERQPYFVDADDDGHGTQEARLVCAATVPVGYSNVSDDCDDTDQTIFTEQSFYTDADGDGVGSEQIQMLCEQVAPEGFSSTTGDCDDNNAGIHALQTYYEDQDGDGIGSETTQAFCSLTAPQGFSDQTGDCDDDNAAVFAGQIYFTDADGDGFGDANATQQTLCAAVAPTGFSQNNTDCDDQQNNVYPGATEICGDDVDQDCSGTDLSCNTLDQDGDGFTGLDGDCDDDNNQVYPGAAETCGDDIDQNCDGHDEACVIEDADQDGFTLAQGDCDDTNNLINPAAAEICGDGIDQDCSGADLSCNAVDLDGDGYSADQGDCNEGDNTIYPGANDICDDGIDQDCSGTDLSCNTLDQDGDGVTGLDGDCNDNNNQVYPGAAETCGDGIDQNCDGHDEACVIEDADQDGFTLAQGDCDDTNNTVYPGALERGDALDNNCNGKIDEELVKAYVSALPDKVEAGESIDITIKVTNRSGFTTFDLNALLGLKAEDGSTTRAGKPNSLNDLFSRSMFRSSEYTCSFLESCSLIGEQAAINIPNDGREHQIVVRGVVPENRNSEHKYYVQVDLAVSDQIMAQTSVLTFDRSQIREALLSGAGLSGISRGVRPYVTIQ